jgi:hypothetical protein
MNSTFPVAVKCVDNRIERVADDAVAPLDARLGEHRPRRICHCRHCGPPPSCEVNRYIGLIRERTDLEGAHDLGDALHERPDAREHQQRERALEEELTAGGEIF